MAQPADFVVQESNEATLGPVERRVIENFWPPGRQFASGSRLVKTLYRGHAKSDYREVAEAIERLRERGYVVVDAEMAFLETDRMAEISAALGR